jgi:ABC-type polysaccharide/polyol phosphate transport system ATPase subunit
MNKDIAIKLTNVSKKYHIYHEKPTLIEKFVKLRNEKFVALDNINLTIKRGEQVGFIGPNGSGKTTLMKIIAGITKQTSGTIERRGKIISLIDLEAGFHSDLTGEQNIYLNGMLLGMSKREINEKIARIIEFTDIKQFIDAPLYTYSQGMKLRLGFAVAAHSNPDTLILDEGFLAGDADFQKKALKKISEFVQKGKTVIVSSHWLEYIKENCTAVVIMKQGKIYKHGSVRLIDAYIKRLENR